MIANVSSPLTCEHEYRMGSLTSSYYGSSNDEADTPSASFQTADGQKFKKPKIEPEGKKNIFDH